MLKAICLETHAISKPVYVEYRESAEIVNYNITAGYISDVDIDEKEGKLTIAVRNTTGCTEMQIGVDISIDLEEGTDKWNLIYIPNSRKDLKVAFMGGTQ